MRGGFSCSSTSVGEDEDVDVDVTGGGGIEGVAFFVAAGVDFDFAEALRLAVFFFFGEDGEAALLDLDGAVRLAYDLDCDEGAAGQESVEGGMRAACSITGRKADGMASRLASPREDMLEYSIQHLSRRRVWKWREMVVVRLLKDAKVVVVVLVALPKGKFTRSRQQKIGRIGYPGWHCSACGRLNHELQQGEEEPIQVLVDALLHIRAYDKLCSTSN